MSSAGEPAMRAAVLRHGRIEVDEVPVPVPGPGELRLRVEACGICGTDVGARRDADGLAAAGRMTGRYFRFDPALGLVLGHEFSGTVVARGPDSGDRIPDGARVVSLPTLPRPPIDELIGFSNAVPGAFAEQVLVHEAFTFVVPEGLDADRAALTEPLAVARHTLKVAALEERHIPVVVGAGPIGLAVVHWLADAGREPIVVLDPSPARRRLAGALGAAVSADPMATAPAEVWADVAAPRSRAVVFDCVGKPGMLDAILGWIPPKGRIVIAGMCIVADTYNPILGFTKEISIAYASGYSAHEFAATLEHIAADPEAVEPFITGRTGLEGINDAFDQLAAADAHAKIMVLP